MFLNLAETINLAPPQNVTQFSASKLIIDMDMSTGAALSADIIYQGGSVSDGVFIPVTNSFVAHLDQAELTALLSSNPLVAPAAAQMIYTAIQINQGVIGTIE